MSDKDAMIARTDAAIDQMWAEAERFLPEITRIGVRGISVTDIDNDHKIVMAMMKLVGAEIHQRRAKRENPET